MNTVLAIVIVVIAVIAYFSGVVFTLALLFKLLANITESSWQGMVLRALMAPINLGIGLSWPVSLPIVAAVAAILFAANVVLDAIFDFVFYAGIDLANKITGDD